MIRFSLFLTLILATLCHVGRAATIVGPVYQSYSNRPYSGPILLRPLSTPLPNTPNLVTGGDFIVRTDTNGLFSVELQPGNYRVQVGADRPFVIDVPTNAASYTLLERITNALSWNSSIIPATNTYQLALTTRSGVVKTTSDQADPVAWLTNDTATLGQWLGNITANTIDELIATTAPSFDVDNIVVNGWSTEQDGRGGQWYYDYGATTTTNTGMVVAWGSGRLLRKWDKEVDPKWFGANESCGADATTALQAAIDFAADPTYGWQASTGQSQQTGFTVLLPGCYITSADLIPKGAVEIRGTKRGSGSGDFGANGIIHVKHGGNGFTWDVATDAPLYRSPTIRDLYFTGYSETYQQNKKAITGVTSRTVFTVADADAPPTLDDPTIWASNNTCFFYDNEGAYLGSGRIASTSSAAGTTTVTLATGSDVYTSVNASVGNKLTTACKVAWPTRITAESAGGVGDFNDPSASGSCAIFLKNTTGSVFGIPRIENIYANRFHAGIRIGPKLLGAQNGGFKDFRFSYSRFAGIATPRPPNTADMFFQGVMFASGYYNADFGVTRTNTADVVPLRYSTYGVWGVPDLSKWDSLLAEESAYANVYSHRTIAPSFGYLFADGIIRYGIALGPGYYAYSGTTTSALDNWFSVGRLLLKNQLDNLTIDTIHTDQTGVYFELTDTAKFASIAVDQLHVIKSGTTHPAITAFNLQPAAYNNRARIAQVIERNGVATWSQAGSKVPEVDVPNHSTAADVDTGFYQPATTQRDYAVSGTRLLSLTPGNVLIEKAGGLNLFTLSNPTTTNAVSMTIGTGSIAFDDAVNSRRIGSLSSSATDATLQIGSAAYSGTARGSQINFENASGTDAAAGTGQIYGPRATGSSSGGGGIDIYTPVAGSSGTALQGSSVKLRIPRVGGIALPGQASDPSALIAGHFFFNSATRNFRFFDGSYWQPMSAQADEVSVASASTVNLGFQTSDKVYITGTKTINSFGAALPGTRRNIRFGGVLTLTYNASSMVLPSGVSITTAANDTGEAVCISTNLEWRVIWYQRASGAALVSSGGVSDGDKGDIVVTESGATYTINNSAVTYAKMQNVSAVSKLLGRNSTTTGPPEEITLGSGLTMTGTTLSASGGGGGSGDVVGPASATDNAVVRYDGTTGKLVQNSAATIADTTGDITAGKYNGLTISSTTGTLTVSNGKTLSAANTVTLSGTDGSTITFGGGGTVAYTANNLSVFASTTSAQLAGVLSNETGTGLTVFNDGATLTNSTLNGLTFTGTAGSTLNVGAGGTLGTAAYTASSAYQASDTDLTAVAGLATTGLISRTGSGTAATRTITAPAAGITVSNGDGVAGNPTLALANDLSAVEGLSGTGIARRTATDTWTVGTTVSIAEGGTGQTTASAALDALNVAETTIASATTTSIGGVASDKVSITGTTTITSFGTAAAGVKREGRFTGALTLTHNATSLIIPGGASIVTAAGDRFAAYSLGSGNWVVTYYTKADGTALVGGGGGGAVATDTIWDAAGDLVVGTGANTAARLAPPTKLSGSTLHYGPAGVEWVHPSTHYIYRNDLLINTVPFDWNSLSSSGSADTLTPEAGAVGIFFASSGSGSPTYRHHFIRGNFVLGRGRTIIEWKVRLPNLSDATDTYTAYVGMYDHQTTPVDGAWFEYSHGVNSGNWVCKVANNSSTTSNNTTTAASTAWTTFTIEANSGATEVKFYIDGTLVVTETGSNIPSSSRASNISYGIAKTAGTTNVRSIYADYVDVYVKY